MRLPRVRFTVRRMMVAVAVLAIVLGIEVNLAAYARNLASDLGDGEKYIWSEAVTVWAMFHIPVMLTLLWVSLVRYLLHRGQAAPDSTISAEPAPPPPE